MPGGDIGGALRDRAGWQPQAGPRSSMRTAATPAHPGAAAFTVGQRAGLGVALGERQYVASVDVGRQRHPARPARGPRAIALRARAAVAWSTASRPTAAVPGPGAHPPPGRAGARRPVEPPGARPRSGRWRVRARPAGVGAGTRPGGRAVRARRAGAGAGRRPHRVDATGGPAPARTRGLAVEPLPERGGARAPRRPGGRAEHPRGRLRHLPVRGHPGRAPAAPAGGRPGGHRRAHSSARRSGDGSATRSSSATSAWSGRSCMAWVGILVVVSLASIVPDRRARLRYGGSMQQDMFWLVVAVSAVVIAVSLAVIAWALVRLAGEARRTADETARPGVRSCGEELPPTLAALQRASASLDQLAGESAARLVIRRPAGRRGGDDHGRGARPVRLGERDRARPRGHGHGRQALRAHGGRRHRLGRRPAAAGHHGRPIGRPGRP